MPHLWGARGTGLQESVTVPTALLANSGGSCRILGHGTVRLLGFLQENQTISRNQQSEFGQRRQVADH